MRAAVAAAEDDRLVGAVDATGLLPAPAATLTVADQLAGTGVVAETAWVVLARDYTPAARARAASSRPDIVSGGRGAGPRQLGTRARCLLTVHPTLAHIPLVTADELRTPQRELMTAGTGPAWPLPAVPLHDGPARRRRRHCPPRTTCAAAVGSARTQQDALDRAEAERTACYWAR